MGISIFYHKNTDDYSVYINGDYYGTFTDYDNLKESLKSETGISAPEEFPHN